MGAEGDENVDLGVEYIGVAGAAVGVEGIVDVVTFVELGLRSGSTSAFRLGGCCWRLLLLDAAKCMGKWGASGVSPGQALVWLLTASKATKSPDGDRMTFSLASQSYRFTSSGQWAALITVVEGTGDVA